MLKESLILIRSKMLLDVVVLSAIILTVHNRFVHPETFALISPFLVVVITNLVTWFLCARAFGLYGDLRLKKFSIEWVIFLKSFGLYALLTSFVAFQVFSQYPYGRHQFLTQCALIFLIFPAQKVLVRIVAKKIWNSTNMRRRVLIVGAGKAGLDFYHTYVRSKNFGYELAGFIDNQTQPTLNGHYLGKMSEIDSIISRHELDDIVVTLPLTKETEINHIVNIAERQGKRVKIIPNYEQFENGRMQIDRMGNLSMITLQALPLDLPDNKFYKRVFDIAFSLIVLLLVFTWLFPIIALIIKCTSKGPVFFRQERWGLNNRSITCFKFRTMVSCSKDVDQEGQYQQASKDDPRITRVGRFLRKTSMDELPQFLNVLFGSMSVIGPRPHPVPLNIASKGSIEKYLMRHWVKPGISGWAQVNGFRGETKESRLMKERVKHDVWYIENWTFWLDLQIIVQTVVNLVKGEKNAY